MIVAGVDAARGGWVAVVLDDGRFERLLWKRAFSLVLDELRDAAAIGVDIPIGDPPEHPRPADVAARRFVGARGGSVFPTPIRAALHASTHVEASELSRASIGKGISIQSYGLRHRILEVEPFALADARIIEVHPEVSFRALVGHELPPKRTLDGLRMRVGALHRAGIEVGEADDDVADAAVAAWTAARFAVGRAQPLPADHRDRIGAIWY